MALPNQHRGQLPVWAKGQTPTAGPTRGKSLQLSCRPGQGWHRGLPAASDPAAAWGAANSGGRQGRRAQEGQSWGWGRSQPPSALPRDRRWHRYLRGSSASLSPAAWAREFQMAWRSGGPLGEVKSRGRGGGQCPGSAWLWGGSGREGGNRHRSRDLQTTLKACGEGYWGLGAGLGAGVGGLGRGVDKGCSFREGPARGPGLCILSPSSALASTPDAFGPGLLCSHETHLCFQLYGNLCK